MERATRQYPVFKANLNLDRENVARSSASIAQVLHFVALEAGQFFKLAALVKLVAIRRPWIEILPV